jgi:hypothetical protein
MLFHFNTSQAAVWNETNQWNESWESQYKEWVRANANVKMFSEEIKSNGEPNPYYGIRVDCADLVYSLRIIFSFENKLPFAMTNPVRINSSLITNQFSRYDSVVEGVPRLKKFLVYVYDLVSTHGLPQDTYSIGFKDIGPGSIILTTRKNHHSWTIKDISKSGNPKLIFNSTVGRFSGFEVQERQSWPNPFWVFEPEVDPTDASKSIDIYLPGSYAGFRYWRPLQYLKQSEKLVPAYSEEQHTIGLSKWKTAAQNTLAQVNETIDQAVSRLLKDACSDYKQRVDAVLEAETYKNKLAADFASGKSEEQSVYIKEFMSDPERPSDNRCMTYKMFDQYSTPSRDKRLIDAIILARAYFSFGLKKFDEKAFSASNLALYKSIFPMISASAAEEAQRSPVKISSNYCAYEISREIGKMSLAQFKYNIFAEKFSSNPNDSYTARFGFKKTEKDLGETCPAYDLSKAKYDLNKIEQEMMREVLSSPFAQ